MIPNTRFLQRSFTFFKVRSSGLGKDITGLKREKLELKTFKTLQYNITRTLNINSSNIMFCSMHDFIN